ncbi:hypothetical protein J7J00_23995 [Bacillus sp. ISL-4]|jgi:hypothetical protein|uniref:hypothetical protein n=1 Tax=Bacillaceae TaxID=186817 RepID=UPI001BE6C0AF|nr:MULTISPECIES: hypothetical protein [Bacillaceae]MBT2668501.1 hypothetical protein [Bacillus sp. ISL-4]MBT2673884.1 hypothetical protein [Streptomyces sp. ISL-14]MDR4924682.1 hypothetical protein [Peribacillus simplex]WHX90575.1 hypothetical protein QNH50_21610 [Peribacillus simplex]
MANENIQMKMEHIWQDTCGSWENCTETTIQSFLAKSQEGNIDPQYCMSWVEQHKAQIPEWNAVSKVSLDWVNQHTSTGSPISIKEDF